MQAICWIIDSGMTLLTRHLHHHEVASYTFQIHLMFKQCQNQWLSVADTYPFSFSSWRFCLLFPSGPKFPEVTFWVPFFVLTPLNFLLGLWQSGAAEVQSPAVMMWETGGTMEMTREGVTNPKVKAEATWGTLTIREPKVNLRGPRY